MGAIGIAIDGRWLSACQQVRASELAVHLDRGVGASAIPDATEVELFASVLERNGFVGRRVALSAPAGITRQSVLDLPPAKSGAPIATIAQGEMARLHKLVPGEFEVGVVPMAAPPRGSAPSGAIALAHDDAEALLVGFDACGLDVVAIEPASLAVLRASGLDRRLHASAVMELGWDALRIVISVPTGAGQGGTPAYERTVEAGGLAGVHEQLAEQLGLDDEVADFALAELGLSDSFDDERQDWARSGDVRELCTAWVQRVAAESEAAVDYARQRFGVEIDEARLCGCGTIVPGVLGAIDQAASFSIDAIQPWAGLDWLSGPAAGVCKGGW